MSEIPKENDGLEEKPKNELLKALQDHGIDNIEKLNELLKPKVEPPSTQEEAPIIEAPQEVKPDMSAIIEKMAVFEKRLDAAVRHPPVANTEPEKEKIIF